ncbi:L,D-transpeptidase [Streptomyces sp. A7024]|uniref:L,D-transpeptidase n=1 Tax=Streptomyces coryli TaxID=1128680 RepID=A0A6G4U3U7_9ACTN|nr:Ig-like domain-containing protein [Streptomyces coryli]NGN66420.1 L,D-transpeptidase [Streptomyces coryli]
MSTPRRRTVISCTLMLLPLTASLTACGGDSHPLAGKPYDAAKQITLGGAAKGVRAGEKADPSKPLLVRATDDGSRITDVTAVDAQGRYVRGRLSDDGTRWRSTVPLAAQAAYTVHVATEDTAGSPGRRSLEFRTGQYKGKGKRLKVEFGPGNGKYGVGQPITAKLSAKVENPEERAAIERGLKVDSEPRVSGAWYWVSDEELHWRPKDYWPAKAKVRATSSLKGIKIRDGLYGSASKPVKLNIGERIVAITDASSHSMTVYKNGKVINEIPVTTGKPGFETRNGKKVILEQQQYVRMTGASIGVAGTSEDYNMDVYWATRVTWSGEYVHSAPWSVGSQGSANVSHGCTGMSPGNAQWFYDTVRQGDIVEVVGSYGETMEPFGNGFGDWNMSWKDWRKGSELTKNVRGKNEVQTGPARLRPSA